MYAIAYGYEDMSGFLKKRYRVMWSGKKYRNPVNCKQKKYKKRFIPHVTLDYEFKHEITL